MRITSVLITATKISTGLDLGLYSAREYPATWAGWGMDKLIGDVMSNTLRIPCSFLMI